MAQHGPDAIARWVDVVNGKNVVFTIDYGRPPGTPYNGMWWQFVIELPHMPDNESICAWRGPAAPPALLTNCESAWVGIAALVDAKQAADTSMAALDAWWASTSTEAGVWFGALTPGQRASIRATLSACRP